MSAFGNTRDQLPDSTSPTTDPPLAFILSFDELSRAYFPTTAIFRYRTSPGNRGAFVLRFVSGLRISLHRAPLAHL